MYGCRWGAGFAGLTLSSNGETRLVAGPELGCYASSGRAWRLSAARHPQDQR